MISPPRSRYRPQSGVSNESLSNESLSNESLPYLFFSFLLLRTLVSAPVSPLPRKINGGGGGGWTARAAISAPGGGRANLSTKRDSGERGARSGYKLSSS